MGVNLYAKQAGQVEVFGKVVSQRHAEEMALIQKFENPPLNRT